MRAMETHDPVLTGLAPDPRRAGSVQLFVDGKPLLTVAAAVVGQEALTEGMVLTDPLHARLCRAADAEAALRAALRALARRPYAQEELCRRLVHRGHPPEASEEAVTKAASLGLLDDQEFTETYVRIHRERGHGPARLRRDLLGRGVAPELVDRALRSDAREEEDEVEILRELAARRAGRVRGLPRRTQIRRLTAYLARRGYTGAQAGKVVREVLQP